MFQYFFLILLFIISCTEFPTTYQSIENDKIRQLDFVYNPVDVSVGDTVTLKAVFAGSNITADMVNWKVSYKVAINNHGFDTAYDVEPLECNPQLVSYSEGTSALQISFVIPDSVLYYSPIIKTNWIDALPTEYQNLIRDNYRKLSREEIIDTLAKLASIIKKSDENQLQLVKRLFDENDFKELAVLLQIFTVKIHLFADIKGEHCIRDEITVRYNNVFNCLSKKYFRINTNPIIDSLLIYKVFKPNLSKFSVSDSFITIRLNDSENNSETVIPIDRNCTYFLRSFTSNIDTSLTLEDLNIDTFNVEKHIREYFFQVDSTESKDVGAKDYLKIKGTDVDSIALLVPPSVDKLKRFTLWLKVYDQFLNEVYRKDASILKEFKCKFTY